jgi:hypothetical protein
MTEEEALTKIRLDLPNHPLMKGESMWAKHVGGHRYEVRNIPFYAYGLSFYDVVEAIAPSPADKPVIRRVVEPGGHRTLRVMFTDAVPRAERGDLLATLNVHRAYFENADGKLYAIDVEPGGDYDLVREQLDGWSIGGKLDYETCEPRVAGSFDAAPEE